MTGGTPAPKEIWPEATTAVFASTTNPDARNTEGEGDRRGHGGLATRSGRGGSHGVAGRLPAGPDGTGCEARQGLRSGCVRRYGRVRRDRPAGRLHGGGTVAASASGSVWTLLLGGESFWHLDGATKDAPGRRGHGTGSSTQVEGTLEQTGSSNVLCLIFELYYRYRYMVMPHLRQTRLECYS